MIIALFWKIGNPYAKIAPTTGFRTLSISLAHLYRFLTSVLTRIKDLSGLKT